MRMRQFCFALDRFMLLVMSSEKSATALPEAVDRADRGSEAAVPLI